MDWLRRPLNWLWLGLVLGLLTIMLVLASQVRQLKTKVINKETAINLQRTQLLKQKRLNRKVIYVSKANQAGLSTSQQSMVKFLSQLFTDGTNYSDAGQYSSVYQKAQANFAMDKYPDLYNQLFFQPNEITAYKLQSINLRTQVLVTGSNSYQVVVMYVVHHDNSDMDSPENMITKTKVFDIQGTIGHFTQCQLDKEVNANATVVTYGDVMN